MKKLDNTKVSEDTPKLGLETGDQNAIASAVVNPVGETTATVETQTGDQNAIASAVVNPVGETTATVETQTGDQNAPALPEVKSFIEGGLVTGASFNGDQNAVIPIVQNLETAKAGAESNELVWIRVLLPLAGKFLMPHDPGAEFEIDKNQGEVIVEAAYAEYLTAEEIAAK